MNTEQPGIPETKQWCAGSNEEWFNAGPFDTREQAIAEALTMWPDRDHVFIGVQKEYRPFSRDYVEEMLELEACDVSDECGADAADNWPPFEVRRTEAATEANRKIAAILAELCGECTVWGVEDVERIERKEVLHD